MFKNNLKTALRFLKFNKVFAIINALALSIALAVSFTIFLYVINELSYDHCHKNSNRIFRVLTYHKDLNLTMAGTPYILENAIKEDLPQIEKAVNCSYVRGLQLKLNDQFIDIPQTLGTSSDIFDIFSFPLIKGPSHQPLLENKNSLVISREIAEKFFPGQNPVSKEIEGKIKNELYVFTINGVIEDIPENSSLQAKCFVNGHWTIEPINSAFGSTDADKNWMFDFWMTFVLLKKGSNVELLENQLKKLQTKHVDDQSGKQFSMQSLSDVYLHSDHILNSMLKSGNFTYVKLFSVIALLVIIVSSINYIVLSTAVSSVRAKEIGLRKTFGASNNNIRNQMLSESVLLATIVLPFALLMMWFALPYAGKLFQTQLNILIPNMIIYFSLYLSFTILIGGASGSYTSAYLARLRTLDVLKNNLHSGKGKKYFRNSLIIIQLVIFCSFVACTIIVHNQFLFAIKKDTGYYTHDILLIDISGNSKGYSSYINSIKSNSNVISVAGTMFGPPTESSIQKTYPSFQNNEEKVKLEAMSVDFNYLKTMGITIVQGRDFSEEYGNDLFGSVILNETAVKQLAINDPVGKTIGDRTIIGIVKDFNFHSIRSDIPPLEINMTDKYILQIAVHYKSGTLNSLLPVMEAEWKKVSPDVPFNYAMIEDLIKSQYTSEKNLTTIVLISALLTILIAMIGLFGLTFFLIRSRTKEIGIKKVFGISQKKVLIYFLREYVIIVLISALLSVPMTLYFMMKWLSNYSYKARIDWWVFLIVFGVATLVVLFTVFLHVFNASRANPVKVLKYE